MSARRPPPADLGAPDDRGDPWPSTVLVPHDGTVFAERALTVATRLAARLGVPTGIVRVAPPGRAIEREHLDELRDTHRLAWSEIVVGTDTVAELLAVATARRAMICMAGHSHGRHVAWSGSTSEAVATGSDFPVVNIGRGVDVSWLRPATRLVVAVDGSAESETALEPAARWAVRLGLRMHIVTVVEPTMNSPRADGSPDRRFGPPTDEHRYVTELAERLSRRGFAVVGDVVPDPISPADGLAQLLGRLPDSIVVMAFHARAGVARFVHGSAAGNILDRSPVPTVLLPIRPSPPDPTNAAPGTP